MKILTADYIKQADLMTIRRRPVTSVDLMEEASCALAESFLKVRKEVEERNSIMIRKWLILAGKGNNGGDGLAVARLLYQSDEKVEVLLASERKEMTEETRANLDRLPDGIQIRQPDMPVFSLSAEEEEGTLLVDALLGSGIHGPVREPYSSLIRMMNASGLQIWSIDLPSGLPTEPPLPVQYSAAVPDIVRADRTFTIAYPKLSLLLPETGFLAGKIEVVPLRLDPEYLKNTVSPFFWIDRNAAGEIQKKYRRDEFMHKGRAGHVLLVCGSVGMTGAAVLSAGGALRSGCGLVTLHLPESERGVLHSVHPAVILSRDPGEHFSVLPAQSGKYTAVGAGCGMGQHEESAAALRGLMEWGKPMVLDADALNILAAHPEWKKKIPAGSVLTPHLGELRRLVGDWNGAEEKMLLVRRLAAETGACIAVKGAHTMTVTPDGRFLFNGSGNPGMAKGGSGDVLAGLIAGLLAYGYSAEDAAVIGVWRHGLAGDAAAEESGEDAMNSEDLYRELGRLQF